MGGNSNRYPASFYKINPSSIVLFEKWVDDSEFENTSYYNFLNKDTTRITYQGEMTKHARKRLSKALNLLLEISQPKNIINPTTGKRFKFRLAFQTLTLSASQGFIPDSQIKKSLLEPYLRTMRRKGMKNYVWKSELQRNGNIHFHIITDCFIIHTDIRNTWNNLQSKMGFISEFEKKHGHRDPNSTDVKAVTKEKEALAYLLKYMLKDKDKTGQQKLESEPDKQRKGKVWDCSQNLKIKNDTYDFLTRDLAELLNYLSVTNKVREVVEEHYKLYFMSPAERKKFIPPRYLAEYERYLAQVKQSG